MYLPIGLCIIGEEMKNELKNNFQEEIGKNISFRLFSNLTSKIPLTLEVKLHNNFRKCFNFTMHPSDVNNYEI